jgi:hypothetical protein
MPCHLLLYIHRAHRTGLDWQVLPSKILRPSTGCAKTYVCPRLIDLDLEGVHILLYFTLLYSFSSHE